jgi:4-carboxymuconolactone decarboxylase
MKNFSEIGDKTRREVLGEDWYRLNIDNMTEFDRPWQIYATNTNWASTWSRNIIPRQTFSMINLAMLATAGRFNEFEHHFRNALLRTKVPLEQLRELMLHISQYCGQATGAEIWKISRRVLKEEKIDLSQLKRLDVSPLYHLPD